MNCDDETLLTAYLDGELDPDQRLRVEAALREVPALGDRLRALAEVRELIADLPRPTLALDLAPAVLARIDHHRPGDLVRIGPWSLTRARLATGLGTAALLLLSVTLGLLAMVRTAPPDRPARPLVAEAQRPVRPVSRLPKPRPEPPERAPRTPAAQPEMRAKGVASTVALNAPRDEVEAARERDHSRIRALLESPDLRKIFVVTDTIGSLATARVDRLIQETPRTESAYGRITVTQGIVIDPRHPNEATVFALVMNDRELEQFRTRLNREFPGAIEETGAKPAVVRQLSEVGQIAVLPGTPPSELDTPSASSSLALNDDKANAPVARRDISALRQGPTPAPEQTQASPTAPPREEAMPPMAQSRAVGARHDALARGADARDRDASRHDRAHRRPSSVVLVWVTTREPGRR